MLGGKMKTTKMARVAALGFVVLSGAAFAEDPKMAHDNQFHPDDGKSGHQATREERQAVHDVDQGNREAQHGTDAPRGGGDSRSSDHDSKGDVDRGN
jgi:hypothetical protein